ncbi:methylmalonyl-CoA mutase family protein [Streptomyces sp. NHF165]|uniref:methylmalonyl-CoA mutase family protein n=1 Tax=Streptomyces sp. NHF165 TaxID=2175864 RepID=UPI00132E7632|nr:methylmalonyl-CoA mutase family protein [Streptomyces sp. NHF165]QHF95772.1 methylmalonyl-CoA mutase [Streptomyces sp. NHF165]
MGKPGEYPFDAGLHPGGYTTRPWTVRQLAGLGDSTDTNTRFRYLLDAGETGLSLAFDLPTQMGLDPDHELASGEVGRTGVSVATVDDLAAVFAGIPLDEVSVSFTINATAPMILAMWIVAAEESGCDPVKLRGTVQNEMLKEHLARNAVVFDVATSLRFSIDVIEHCVQHMPGVNPVSLSGGHAREAGAERSLEIACGIADAETYLAGMLERGWSVDDVAPQFSFIFGTHMELLAEAAKFRAARRLYATRMRTLHGARNPKSHKMRIQVNTFGSALAAGEPLNNVARTTVQALAAVLGGVQSLHVCSFDEAVQIPGRLAARTALRIQQILLEETDLVRHIDPLGGSEAVERLAEEIERDAAEWLERIADRGGMLAVMRSGWLQAQIDDMAYRDPGPQVGVRDGEVDESEQQLLAAQRRTSTAPGRRVPFRRTDCPEQLARLAEAVRADRNIMPELIEAVRARASIGQLRRTIEDALPQAG